MRHCCSACQRLHLLPAGFPELMQFTEWWLLLVYYPQLLGIPILGTTSTQQKDAWSSFMSPQYLDLLDKIALMSNSAFEKFSGVRLLGQSVDAYWSTSALLFLGIPQSGSFDTSLQEKGLWNFGSLLEKYSASYLVLLNKKDEPCEEAILRLRLWRISNCEIPSGYPVLKLHQQEFGRMRAKDCLQIQTGVYLEFLFWIYNRVMLLWGPWL